MKTFSKYLLEAQLALSALDAHKFIDNLVSLRDIPLFQDKADVMQLINLAVEAKSGNFVAINALADYIEERNKDAEWGAAMATALRTIIHPQTI